MATITANGLSKKQMKNMWRDMKSVPQRKYEDIPFYKLLRDELMNVYKDNKYVYVEETYMGHSMNYFTYMNNSCLVGLGNAGFLRFGTRGKSIDISRVDVEPEYHGKGIGTAVMDTFFLSLISVIKNLEDKSTVPDIVLECYGKVGCGATYKETPIPQQVKFFNKFGFEVVREDQHGYTHMKLSPEKFADYVQKNLLKKLTEFEKELVTS
jgi:GNAT superfamily N-acetyltransferase